MFPFNKRLFCPLLLVVLVGTHSSGINASCCAAQTRNPQQPATPSAVREEEGYVTTDDGVRLFYQRAGSGSQTLIIPGRLFLYDYLKPLATSFTIISYDMRNRGRSDAVADSSKISIQYDIKDLETVRQHFKVKKFVPVGYSYLGMMVMLYAAEHLDSVERIVQLGPVPLIFGTEYPVQLTNNSENTGADPNEVARVEQLEKQGYAKTHPKEFCEAQWSVSRFGLVGNPANVGKLGTGWCEMPNEWPVNFYRHLQYHFGSVQKLNNSWEQMSRITKPVLTIHGTRDRNAPYGGGREWALKLPNARLLTVRNAAHQSFAEYPEIVTDAIRTFVGGKWPKDVEKVTAL